jgi:hypothetical protein
MTLVFAVFLPCSPQNSTLFRAFSWSVSFSCAGASWMIHLLLPPADVEPIDALLPLEPLQNSPHVISVFNLAHWNAVR